MNWLEILSKHIADPTLPEKRVRHPTLVRLCANRLKLCYLCFLGFCEG